MRRLAVVLSFVLAVALIGCGGKASANLTTQKVTSELQIFQQEDEKLVINTREEPVKGLLTNLTSNVPFETKVVQESGDIEGFVLWPAQELDATYTISNDAPLGYDLRGSLPGLRNSATYSNGLSSSSNITVVWERPDMPGQSLSRDFFSWEFRLYIGPNETITVVAHIRMKANAPAGQKVGSLGLTTERIDISP